jgi:hypothetical protein
MEKRCGNCTKFRPVSSEEQQRRLQANLGLVVRADQLLSQNPGKSLDWREGVASVMKFLQTPVTEGYRGCEQFQTGSTANSSCEHPERFVAISSLGL